MPRFVALALAILVLVTTPEVSGAGQRCPAPELPPGVTVGKARLRYTPDCLPFVRTPSRYTKRLAGFPWPKRHVLVDGLQMAYVDAGPPRGEPVLLLHGEPSWSYLYRKMIPILVAAGYRVIAPDMIGMGRSDKPVEFSRYRYLQHVAWVEAFLDQVPSVRRRGAPRGLQGITLFCQDWGSLIGLRVLGDQPDRFARLVVANGRLPVIPFEITIAPLPDPPLLDPTLPFPFPNGPPSCPPNDLSCFRVWARYALTSPNLRASEVVEALTATSLTAREHAAYDAPFPALIYMTGVRVFPALINTLGQSPTNVDARAVLDQFTKPTLTLFGRLDMNLGTDSIQAEIRDRVPGAAGQPHWAYPDASHFIQEDKGPDLARRVAEFMRANPMQ